MVFVRKVVMPRLIVQLLTVVSLLACAAAFDHAGGPGSHHPASETMTAAADTTAGMVLVADTPHRDEATPAHAGQREHHSAHACDQPATAPPSTWIAAEPAPVSLLPVPGDAERPGRDDGCRPAPPSLLLVTCVCRR